jgi:hypothetical protein
VLAVQQMLQSNAAASEAATAVGIRCATDVTGFGLLGHLRELVAASGVGAVIRVDRVPAIPGVLELVGYAPGAVERNREHIGQWVDFDDSIVPSSEVNGGVLATLADMACALALCTHFDGQMPFVTSDLHIRYLEPALGPVTVEAQVLRRSLRSAVLDCRLTCQGRLAGLCTAHFVIRAGEEAP